MDLHVGVLSHGHDSLITEPDILDSVDDATGSEVSFFCGLIEIGLGRHDARVAGLRFLVLRRNFLILDSSVDHVSSWLNLQCLLDGVL